MAENSSRATPEVNPAKEKTCQNIKLIHLKSQAIIDAIGRYNGDGIPTFPLSKNKIPLVKEWNDRDFTLEEHDLPGVAGIGSCPGRWPIPVMIFDVDGAQGRESWAGCLEQYGPLPPTYSVKTGRVDGGEQFYYRIPPGLYVKSTASEFAPKVDKRGTRGQGVLPPTTHKSGKDYQWLFDGHPCGWVDLGKIPILPPRWIQALIDTGNAYYPDQKKDRSSERREFNGHSTAYALKALELETEKIRQAVEYTRNNTLNNAALSLGTLVAGGELSRSLVENALLDAAIDAGLSEREARKTIESGLKAGEREPRQAPEKDGGRSQNGKADQDTKQDTNKRIKPVSIGDFLALEFPARENILNPWLPTQGLVMVYAYRGIGKTFFALSLTYAAASGGSFLNWTAPAPVGVLYIDGEMPAPVMQERLSQIIAGADREPQAPFILLTPDLQPEGMPRIDDERGQRAIEEILTPEIKLIVIDNISTLTAAKENEADGWTPVQAWALRQRQMGRTVLFIHHSGKGGAQRGTSRREDVLDSVLVLKRPIDYHADQGAVFEIHFEKARGLYGDDVSPIEARLSDSTGVLAWEWKTVEATTFDRVVSLLKDGMSQKEIADELSLNKSTVSRHTKRARAEGYL